MYRILIIVGLVLYFLYKIGFFRAFIQVRNNQPNGNFQRRSGNGSVKVEYNPHDKKQKSSFNEGEYIDYEEVN